MGVVTVGSNPAIDRVIHCEHFVPGGHLPSRTVARLAAGKAANVSRAMAMCGAPSVASGFIGAAETVWFRNNLTRGLDITCEFIEVAGATRENITILDPATGQETHLRDGGFAVTPEDQQRLRSWLAVHVGAGAVCVFAGSLPAGSPGVSPQDFLALLSSCPGDARLVVDSSGPALAAAVTRPLWLIKPNTAELATLLQRDLAAQPAAVVAAVRSAALPVEYVLVSLGAQGAVLAGRSVAIHAVARPRRPVVRTVGCGDHLLGGFLAGMQRHGGVAMALREGVALATARAVSGDYVGIAAEIISEVAATTELVEL